MSKKEKNLRPCQQTIIDLWNAKSVSEMEKILADYKKREAEELKILKSKENE